MQESKLNEYTFGIKCRQMQQSPLGEISKQGCDNYTQLKEVTDLLRKQSKDPTLKWENNTSILFCSEDRTYHQYFGCHRVSITWGENVTVSMTLSTVTQKT